MLKNLYEERTTYFFIGKCFDLLNPLAPAYLSKLKEITDKANFREKLVEAKEYAHSQSPEETVIDYLRAYYPDNVALSPEQLAAEEKDEEYRKILFNDYVPYTVREVYESIISFNDDISIINTSLDYRDTYIGFILRKKVDNEGHKIGVQYCRSSMYSGWGAMVDGVIEKFIKIFGLNPSLYTLLLDENYIVQGVNHPVTLPPHRQD